MAGMLPGIAFLLLGIHYLSEAKRSNGASKQGVSGAVPGGKAPASTFSQAFARGGHPLPTAVEQNEYTKLSPTLQRPAKGKLEQVRSLEGRIKRINGQIKLGSTDPAVRKLALEIVAARKPDGSYAVAEKDWEGEARAIFGWVRANMRYTRDSAFADTYVNPARTLFDKKPGVAAAGDCLVAGTLLLRDGHRPTTIENVRPGDKIWGYDKWSEVLDVWSKGVLPVTVIHLNNGSTIECTEDHKVYVHSCEKHGPNCKDITKRWRNCQNREFTVIRIPVSELREGMQLLQPDRIAFGTATMDPRRAYVEGLYLSDGWVDKPYVRKDDSAVRHAFYISGKDGHPKEAQKREVAEICAAFDIPTNWQERCIDIRDREWAAYMAKLGSHAWDKRAYTLNLEEAAASELLRGIMADSGMDSNGLTRTFTTTSRELHIHTRLLLKMTGRTCSERYVPDHGGFGTHPVWRLGVRATKDEGGKDKKLCVKAIDRNMREQPVYDISTDDHYVYLADADATVSNCDDYCITMGALLASIGHSPTLRVVAAKSGAGDKPGWNHIYLKNCLPAGGAIAGAGGKCVPMDASIDKPYGWEVPKSRIHKLRDFKIK